jgi:hypothetical protein
MTKISRVLVLISLTALFYLWPAYPVFAGIVTLNPTANVTALNNRPDTGDTKVLAVCYTPGPAFLRNWFFLQFDLSSIPAGSTVNNAALSLNHTNQNPPALKTNFAVLRCTKVWDEATLTWNNQPSVNGSPVGETLISGEERKLSIDMTGVVQSWINKDYQNYGVKVAWASQTLVDARFMWTFGCRTSDTPPVLLVNYTPPPSPDLGEIPASDSSTSSTGSDLTAISLQVSNVKTKSINQSSVYIIWDTNTNANSYVEFGKTADYGLMAGKNDSATAHSIQLIELKPNTLYHFRVESKGPFGVQAASNDYTFRTAKEEKASAIAPKLKENNMRWLWIALGSLAVLALILVIIIVILLIRSRQKPKLSN